MPIQGTRMGAAFWRFQAVAYIWLTCALALGLGWACKVEHPEWAALSVWVMSQPLRGQAGCKLVMRGLGALVGISVGALLLWASALSPYVVVMGLGLWMGACTWFSYLYTGLLSYGAVLAGVAAVLMTLVGPHTSLEGFDLLFDRLATIGIGVGMVGLGGFWFALMYKPKTLKQHLAELASQQLAYLAQSPSLELVETEELLLSLAEYERAIESQGNCSLENRLLFKHLRHITLNLAELSFQSYLWSEDERLALHHASLALQREDWVQASQHLAPHPRLAACAQAMQALTNPQGHRDISPLPHLKRYRDHMYARMVGLRVTCVMWAVGLVAELTQWAPLYAAWLSLGVLSSIFLRAEVPVLDLRQAFRGQTLGVIVAWLCQWLLWPYLDSSLAKIGVMLPLIGVVMGLVFVVTPPILILGYVVGLLLLLQPNQPVSLAEIDLLLLGLLTLSAPALVALGHRTISPETLQRHQAILARNFELRLQRLVASTQEVEHASYWRMGFAYRGLNLIQMHANAKIPKGEGLALVRYLAAWTHLGILAANYAKQADLPESERQLAKQILAGLKLFTTAEVVESLKALPRPHSPELASALQVVLGPETSEHHTP